MPINNLTTSTNQAFMKLGKIRKGDRGGANNAPRDLDYFRVTFQPGKTAQALEQAFLATYGPKPTEINVRFPDALVPKVWDANFECYKQGSLMAKAATYDDGLRWLFYRDPETSDVLVRNGSPVGAEGRAFFDKKFDVTDPIYYTKTKNEPVYLEPVGRLQVVIPELAGIDVGYFEFQPKSPRDIGNVDRELNAFADFAKAYGKTINGLPFKLIRRQEQVTKNIKGVLSQGPSWVCHLTAGGEWGRKAIEAIERLALPEIIDVEYSSVPDGEFEEFSDEPEYTPAPPPQGKVPLLPRPAAPQPAQPPAQDTGEMIDPLSKWAVEYAASAWNIEKSQAAKEIAKKGLGSSILKSAFEKLVNE